MYSRESVASPGAMTAASPVQQLRELESAHSSLCTQLPSDFPALVQLGAILVTLREHAPALETTAAVSETRGATALRNALSSLQRVSTALPLAIDAQAAIAAKRKADAARAKSFPSNASARISRSFASFIAASNDVFSSKGLRSRPGMSSCAGDSDWGGDPNSSFASRSGAESQWNDSGDDTDKEHGGLHRQNLRRSRFGIRGSSLRESSRLRLSEMKWLPSFMQSRQYATRPHQTHFDPMRKSSSFSSKKRSSRGLASDRSSKYCPSSADDYSTTGQPSRMSSRASSLLSRTTVRSHIQKAHSRMRGDISSCGEDSKQSPACKRLAQLSADVHAALALLRHENTNSPTKPCGQSGQPAVRRAWRCPSLMDYARPVAVAASQAEIVALGKAALRDLGKYQEEQHLVADDQSPKGFVIAAAVGAHGVGKAAACELVATSRAGQTRYSDGAIWVRAAETEMPVGYLLQLVCDVVRKTGDDINPEVLNPECLANQGIDGVLQKAVSIARARFEGRRVLLIIEGLQAPPSDDDAFQSDPTFLRLMKRNVVDVFHSVLSLASQSSCLLLCTTNFTVATEAVSSARRIVAFSSSISDRAVAQHIFRVHSQTSDRDFFANLGEGFPLAIALVGRVLRNAPSQVFQMLQQPLDARTIASLDRATSSGLVPCSLARVLSKVLELLDLGLLSHLTSSKDFPFKWSDMYLSLCIVSEKIPIISLPVLMRLWKIATRAAVRDVVDLFAKLGLVSYGGGLLHVHGVHLAYCKARIANDNTLVAESVWHLRVLTQYALASCMEAEGDSGAKSRARRKRLIAAENASNMKGSVGKNPSSCVPEGVPWWRLCAKDAVPVGGVYLRSELVRHLVNAPGGMCAAAHLLSDFRYLDAKCRTEGIEGLKNDYRVLLSALRPFSSRGLHVQSTLRNICNDARLIYETLELMPRDIRGSMGDSFTDQCQDDCLSRLGRSQDADQGLANQLVARLPLLMTRIDGCAGVRSDRQSMFDNLGTTILTYAKRPWLRPLTNYLDQVGGGFERVIRVGGTVTSVAVNGDASIVVSGTVNGMVLVHDTHTGQCLLELHGHSAYVHAVAISEQQQAGGKADNRRIVSASWDGTVRVWDMSGKCIFVVKEHSDQVFCAALSSNGSCVASGSMDMTVCVFDSLSVGASFHVLEGHQDWVRCVALSSDGSVVVSGSDDTTVRVWGKDPDDSSSMVCRHLLRGHRSRVSCVVVCPNDRYIISGSYDGTVRVWELAGGTALRTFKGPGGKKVLSVSVPEDCKSVVVGYDDGMTRIWKISHDQRVPISEFGNGMMAGRLAVSRDGQRMVSCSFEGCLRVWSSAATKWGGSDIDDRFAGCRGGSADSHARPVSALAVSHDGNFVASGSWDKNIRIWNVASGKCEKTFEGHSHALNALVFTEDGTKLVSASRDETLRIWSIDGGTCDKVLHGHKASVLTVAVSNDGSRIMSGSEDATVRLWDTESNFTNMAPLKRFNVAVLSVALSWNGSIAVAVSADGNCQLWDVSKGPREVKPITSVMFNNFRFGPTTANAALSAYCLKSGLSVAQSSVPLSLQNNGFVSGLTEKGVGVTVSWQIKKGLSSSESSVSEEEREPKPSVPLEKSMIVEEADRPSGVPEDGQAINGRQSQKASTSAFMDSAMVRESRVWTPVFTSSATNGKFVAAGLCNGGVAILQLME